MVVGFLMWGALFDERMCLAFTIAVLSCSVPFTADKIGNARWLPTESLVKVSVPCGTQCLHF
jgi:hypothetical protein